MTNQGRRGFWHFSLTEHYKLCLYNKGRLQAIVPPLAINTNPNGEVKDEMGRQFLYRCRVPDCDRARRGAKMTAYKEFVLTMLEATTLWERRLWTWFWTGSGSSPTTALACR